MQRHHYATFESFVRLFFQQVPHNVVKPTAVRGGSTYRVTKNGQDRAQIDKLCVSWVPVYVSDGAPLTESASL